MSEEIVLREVLKGLAGKWREKTPGYSAWDSAADELLAALASQPSGVSGVTTAEDKTSMATASNDSCPRCGLNVSRYGVYRQEMQAWDFEAALNKIAPFLEGVENAHLRATQIVSALTEFAPYDTVKDYLAVATNDEAPQPLQAAASPGSEREGMTRFCPTCGEQYGDSVFRCDLCQTSTQRKTITHPALAQPSRDRSAIPPSSTKEDHG